MISCKSIQYWGLGLAIAMPALPTIASSLPKERVILTVSVHNDAGIPWETLHAAEEEASRVFREAKIEIQWRSCREVLEGTEARQSENCAEAVFPKHLHLRIARRSIGLSPDTMGISFLSKDGTGCQADLFYEEMKGLRQRGKVSLPIILGHVAAHELGHLLLGTNSHTPQGIMRSVWGHDELVSVSRGALFFSEEQSKQMRARLATFIALAEAQRAPDRPLL